jgi:hypothetical protein
LALQLAFSRGRLLFVLKYLPPERFLSEFVPAEQAWIASLVGTEMGSALRVLYLETLPAAATILARRWKRPASLVRLVLQALQQLYRAAAEEPRPVEPELAEFEFESSLPVVGPVLARLRSLWYGVAARWAVRHLAQQQMVANRAYLRRIEEQETLNAYSVRSLVSLSEELAHIVQQLEQGQSRHE